MATNETVLVTSGNPIRPRVAAWFRAVLAVLTCGVAAWAFIQGAVEIHKGCMAPMLGYFLIWFVGVPLLIVGLPSLFIAWALFRNSMRGVIAALIFDALIGAVLIGGVLLLNTHFSLYGGDDPMDLVLIAGLAAAVVLLFGVEAAGLLNTCRGWKGVWRGYAIFAVALGVVAVAWPLLSNYQHIRHVRVLKEYLVKNLVALPADTPLTVSRTASAGGVHMDHISFRSREYGWGFSAQHYAEGWRLQDKAGWAFAIGASPKIQSVVEARAHLRKLGLPESSLGAKGEAGPKEGVYATYIIEAAISGGSYLVSEYGSVKVCFSKPLVIPER